MEHISFLYMTGDKAVHAGASLACGLFGLLARNDLIWNEVTYMVY
nr:hypothetical protein Iba_chr12dCG20830 [Ipomoea batatas]